MSKKKLKRFIRRYQYELCIGGISIIALIAGTLAIGFAKAFLIIACIDALLIIPGYLTAKPVKGKHVKKQTGNKKNMASLKNQRVTKTSTTTKDKLKNSKQEHAGKPKQKKSWWKRILLVLLLLFIACMILFAGFMAYIVVTAPKFDPDNLYRQESTIVYDVKGKIYAKLGTEKREKVTYNQLPEVLVNAIVATEDARFFQHNGFDLPRFMVASANQLLGRNAGGASTLTMQVSKNNYTSTTASGFEGIKRKFTDIYMSIFQIEKNYTKEEIMEFYVNQPYLGSGAYGVEQACQTYFGKSVSNINLAEAALIAGLFQAPNSYDPYLNPDTSEERRETVLYLMKRHGYINEKEYQAAKALTVEKLLKKTPGETNKYQAFLDTVIEDVEEKTGNNPYNVAMEIYTTMDPDKQAFLDDIMSGKSFEWENSAINAGIAVIDSKTGAVVAVGAGRNRSGERSYNTATMIKRQIGSTAKPLYDYAMGFEKKGWSTYTPFADEPHGYSDGTSIENWNRTFQGFMTLRRALAESRNIPALKAFQANDSKDIKSFVTSVGLSPQLENGILHEAHALGGYNGESPLSLASAYSTFASGGYYTTPYTFSKIVYRKNGETFEPDTKRNKVLSPETAYMITNILEDAASWGIGTNVTSSGAKFSAKTGTSNFDQETIDKYNFPGNAVNDLWVAGFTPDYTVSIWYGYDKINPNYVSTTNTGEHRRLFLTIANGLFKTGSTFTRPSGVVSVTVENYTYPAKLPSANTPNDLKITELFKKGTEPTEVSGRFNTLDNVKNLNSSLSGNTVTLTWDKVIPATQDTSWVKQLFSNSGYANSFIGTLESYNKSHVGTFGYNVYAKEDDGTLRLIDFVTDNKISFTVKSNDATTYVVKSSYSILKTCESSGTEVEINLDSVEAEIQATLNGSRVETVSTGSSYIDPGVTVTSDGDDITEDASISVNVSGPSGSLENVDTSTPGTYTITYRVRYGSYSTTLTRTVIVR